MRPESEPMKVNPSTVFTITALVSLAAALATIRVAVEDVRTELREHREFLRMIEADTHAMRALQWNDHEREYFGREPSREVRLGGFKMPAACPVCAAEFFRDREDATASFRNGYFCGETKLGYTNVECHACGARVRAWWLGDLDRCRFTAMPWSVLPW